MADTPTPISPEATQELQQIQGQLDALYAAHESGKHFRYTDLGGDDAILMLRTRQHEIRTGLAAAAASVSTPTEPSILAQLMVRPGEEPLNSQGQRLQRELESLPQDIHAAAAHAVRVDFPKIIAEVERESTPPRREEAEAAMRQEWGTNYADNELAMRCALDTLPFLRSEIVTADALYAPTTWRLMARVGRRILGFDGPGITDQGAEWMKSRGVAQQAERDRARAESEAAEHKAREALGR